MRENEFNPALAKRISALSDESLQAFICFMDRLAAKPASDREELAKREESEATVC